MTSVDILEQGLAAAEDHRLHDQPDLVDQVVVHEAGDEGGAADSVNVLARLLLHQPDLVDASNDACRRPVHGLQRRRQDEVGCLVGKARVLDLAGSCGPAGERQDAFGVGEDSPPGPPYPGIPSPEHAGVNLT